MNTGPKAFHHGTATLDILPKGFLRSIKLLKNNYIHMKRITINVPDNKYAFFIELVKNLGLKTTKEKPQHTEEEVLKGIEQGFKEVKLIEEGKMEGTSLNDFLDEL